LEVGIGERKGVIPFCDTPFGSKLTKSVTEQRSLYADLKIQGKQYYQGWNAAIERFLELIKGDGK